jgi:hypothetical protein
MPCGSLLDSPSRCHNCCVLCTDQYEPLYPVATTLKGMPAEHRALIEDMAAQRAAVSLLVSPPNLLRCRSPQLCAAQTNLTIIAYVKDD